MGTQKFFDEFMRVSEGAYPQLKLNGATYFRATKELQVRFLLNAFDYKAFTDDKQKTDGVFMTVQKIFPGMKVSVQYVKTYADETVVRNKALEFFNLNNIMLFKRLSDKSLQISVSEGVIKVTLRFDEATCKMIEAGSLISDFKQYLERTFSERADIDVQQCESEDDEELYYMSTTVAGSMSLRLVETKIGQKLFSRNKIETIHQMPNYIIDIKTAGDNIVLCGKVSSITRKKFKNKKYDPNDKKSGPEELPLVSFRLDDTTANIETVCFPRGEDALAELKDGDEVIGIGRVAMSNFSGMLNFTVNALFRCDIDYSSVHAHDRLPVPERYETIRPQPYSSLRVQNLISDEFAAVDEYMRGKAFVVFDLETTSLNVATNEIIEIGAIRAEGDTLTSFSTLVKPKEPIPREASDINGITDSMVAFAPSIEKVMPDFYKFTAGATLVGHNIEGFDVQIIRRIGGDMGYYFDNSVMDTLTMARSLIADRKSYSLESLARDFGFLHEHAHRALSDVEANLELFRELLRRKLTKPGRN